MGSIHYEVLDTLDVIVVDRGILKPIECDLIEPCFIPEHEPAVKSVVFPVSLQELEVKAFELAGWEVANAVVSK